MKLLIIFRVSRDAIRGLPPEELIELTEAWIAWVDKHRKAGNCKEAYVVPLQTQGVFIWEFNSFEEADRLSLECPYYPYMEQPLEIYNLADWDSHQKEAREFLKRALEK
ncbi:hypothetical protein ACFLTQ_00225 [Chloroflexota bacterium]